MSELMLEHVSAQCLSDCMSAYERERERDIYIIYNDIYIYTYYISEHLADHAGMNSQSIFEQNSAEMPKCTMPNCASSKLTSPGIARSK